MSPEGRLEDPEEVVVVVQMEASQRRLAATTHSVGRHSQADQGLGVLAFQAQELLNIDSRKQLSSRYQPLRIRQIPSSPNPFFEL
jgi:hypothetical protein